MFKNTRFGTFKSLLTGIDTCSEAPIRNALKGHKALEGERLETSVFYCSQ